MKIRTLWSFDGDAEKLKHDSARIPAFTVFQDVDKDYAHQLIGKGLAEEVGGDSKQAAPKENKQAKPKENKGKADKPEGDSAADDAGAAGDGQGEGEGA